MFGLVLDVSRHWKLPKRVRLGFSSYFPQNFKSAAQIRYGTLYDPYFPRYGDSSTDQVLAAWINAGVEIFPWLYVGGGCSFGTHARDVTLSMAIDSRNLQLVMERSSVVWKMSTEISPTFGVLLKPLPHLRIGFTFREGMKLLFSGGLKVEANLLVDGELRPFPIPGFPVVVPINSHYRPPQYALGASYQLAENLLVAFDLTYYDWRAYRDEAEQPLNPGMHEVVAPRFGAEYFLRKNLALRAGYGYSPSPLKQQVGTWVNFLDNDLHVFSFGAGYAWDLFGYLQDRPLQFSFCYQFSYLTPRSFLNVYPEAPTLRSSGYVQCVGFGIQMIF